jgi:hypothetical protein
LTHNVYQGFGEDDTAASKEAKTEVGWWLPRDLLEKARRESQQMVVYSSANDRKSVVHISKEEERLAF